MSWLPALIGLQAPPPQGSPFGMLVPMAAIFLIFYFLLIRPQQKKQNEQQKMLEGIERGDNVVTAGGLHGKVTGLTDDVLTVEIAALKGERVRVKVARARIEEAIGGPLEGPFETFDPEPITSSTTGCLYQARLRREGKAGEGVGGEEGEQVVVKVRRPGVRRLIMEWFDG